MPEGTHWILRMPTSVTGCPLVSEDAYWCLCVPAGV